MRGHVDPETLAAFREGLLPRRKAGRVTAHLAECPQCAGLDAQLAGLPALLAHAPAPPMPDALTARIEAAIAAEAAARSAQAPAGVPAADAHVPSADTGVPGTEAAPGTSAPPAGPRGAARSGRRQRAAPGRSRLALGITFAAAAVVVIAGGGYEVSRVVAGGPGASGASSSIAGPPARIPAAPGQNGIGGNQSQGGGSSGAHSPGPDHAAAGTAAVYPVVTSGTNYRASQLKAQVQAALTRSQAAAPASGSGTPSPGPVSRVSACLAVVTKGQRPQLVDVARYEGKPAIVVVVPAGAHTLRALVFAQHCPVTGADLLNSVTLPSPG